MKIIDQGINLAFIAIALTTIFSNIIAFMLQWFLHEEPCTLCLFQRYGMLISGLMALLCLSEFPYNF